MKHGEHLQMWQLICAFHNEEFLSCANIVLRSTMIHKVSMS